MGNKRISRRRNDMISCLPDELVIHILSLLHLKDPGRTSVLSRRWRYVWTYLRDLDFEDCKSLFMNTDDKPLSPNNTVEHYVKWVNQVLTANHAILVNSFKLRFLVNEKFSADIAKWLDFAIYSKRVRNLVMNLATLFGTRWRNTYCLNPYFYDRIFFNKFFNNDNLLSLSLVAVNISVIVLNRILSCCSNLERLLLSECSDTLQMKFSVSSPKLKHLQIDLCNCIGTVELSAPNLTSFVFGGRLSSSVEYHHVPNLVQATFGLLYGEKVLNDLNSISSFSTQLQKLSLDLRQQVCWPSSVLAVAFPNLKQLELVVRTGINFLGLTSFIVACPLLHTFKLKVLLSLSPWLKPVPQVMEIHDGAKHIHKNLKVIKYVGFAGDASCVELALSLTKFSPLLEKFIFNCRYASRYISEAKPSCVDWYTNEMRLRTEAAHNLAEKIRQIKPVKIVIMSKFK